MVFASVAERYRGFDGCIEAQERSQREGSRVDRSKRIQRSLRHRVRLVQVLFMRDQGSSSSEAMNYRPDPLARERFPLEDPRALPPPPEIVVVVLVFVLAPKHPIDDVQHELHEEHEQGDLNDESSSESIPVRGKERTESVETTSVDGRCDERSTVIPTVTTSCSRWTGPFPRLRAKAPSSHSTSTCGHRFFRRGREEQRTRQRHDTRAGRNRSPTWRTIPSFLGSFRASHDARA